VSAVRPELARAQELLCPPCRSVLFRSSYEELVADGIISRDGTPARGITLQQLVDRGIAVHAPHGVR